MTDTPQKEYVLGTGNDELERLGIQHRIWADAAVASWKRAGIGPGSKVLDVGAGPGYASLDLAQLVTHEGQVLAVDESPAFVDFVNTRAKRYEVPQLSAVVGDVQNLVAALPKGEFYDAIYCRWVLCWLPNPEKALQGMLKVLKPGGKLIIHDYFNWKSMTSAPRSKAVEAMVLAAVSSFEDRQGDVDICAKLPALLHATGFEVLNLDVHQRIARGGGLDSTLAWPLTWWRTYGPKLVQLGKLSKQDCNDAMDDLDDIESNPDRFFVCPPLYDIMAIK